MSQYAYQKNTDMVNVNLYRNRNYVNGGRTVQHKVVGFYLDFTFIITEAQENRTANMGLTVLLGPS